MENEGRIRVLHVISDSNIGGAGKYVLSLAGRIPGMEAVVPCNSLLRPELLKAGMPVFETGYMEDKSFDIRAVRGLRRIIKERDPDIVHTHGAFSGRVAARLLPGRGIVATRHSVFDVPPGRSRFPRKQASGMVNDFFCDRYIAVSPAAAENLVKIGAAAGKIRMIYNGVEPAALQNDEQKKMVRNFFGLDEGDFVAVVAARLVKEKGHDAVFDAAGALLGRGEKGIKFLIAGSGPEEARLKRRAESEGLSNIVMAGFISDMDPVYNIACILVNASFGTEATSLSLLEGMSLGTPIVASDFGGNPYVARQGENGLVYPAGNSFELAEAILRLKRDAGLYNGLREGAKRVYEENFTAKLMAEKTYGLYKEMLS